ncbi:UNVERIFIED_CONTAM: putative magnesium transporter NIPA4 [Sesamum calycinum]|uniref:Probable magnesium transporter n=1 Tax=Sesamum calycinum TaxID=2727403 RepID=A0AAW2R728_9LAMI
MSFLHGGLICLVAAAGLHLLSLSIAVLAHVILRERLHIFGVLGCALCVVGSTTIVLHAPQEREIESVTEVWTLLQSQTHIWFYIGVCSLVGSLSVMSVKALGIALKLTLSGMNQTDISPDMGLRYVLTCTLLAFPTFALCFSALDTFNTAVVSPIYYVMFTSLTIVASVIMFKDWDRQNPTQIVTELCGFVTILSGTFLLHRTKDMTDGSMVASRLAKHGNEDGFGDEGIPLRRQDSSRTP